MPKKSKNKEIKVFHEKLGRQKAMGIAYKEDRKVIIDERLEGYDYFETAVHEGVHVLIPEWIEEKVEEFSGDLAKYLWNKIDWNKILIN